MPTLPPPTAVPTATPVPPAATPASAWQPGPPESDQRLARYRYNIQGTVTERLFYSLALGQTEPYDIYFPPGYDQSNRRYPVLYMLHGGGAHRDEWLGYGLIDVAEPAIRSGTLQPMIIVFPQGDVGYWTNNAAGGPRWGDYLWHDVVTHIDAAYRTLPSPASRAIGGVSLGGWGALSNAFLHPDVFGVIGSHSASLPNDDGFRPILGTGDEFKRKDPVTLAASAPGLSSLKIWIDIADQDEWLPRNNELHNALAARKIAHTWQVNPGVHDYTYWMKHTLDYLSFYSSALAGP
jgi:enterochelin esterase-like enzyme